MNGGWAFDETIRLAPELAQLGVEFIEQPIVSGDEKASRRARAALMLPLVAEESCITEAHVKRCADS